MRSAPPAIAGVDIGTNSVLFVVARPSAEGLQVLEERCVVTRLGEGLSDEGSLSAAAAARTVAVLSEIGLAVTALGAAARAVGTSALRRAANADAFLADARRALGFSVEVLSGDEEGRLTYLGALSALPGIIVADEPVVVDVGGGSTEIHGGDVGRSYELGAVRLTERFLASDPPTDEELDAARAHARSVLARTLEPAAVPVVLSGGAATTIAALVAQLDRYDPAVVHGHRLDRQSLEATTQRLARLPLAERGRLPCLPPERADIIVAGAVLLQVILDELRAEEAVVSDRGLRYGLIEEMLDELSSVNG